MTKELLNHVFGSLNSLERYFGRLEAQAGRESEDRLPCRLDQQRKVLKHMRRIANNLQLQVAQNDENAATKSLNIYYCLHAMVRPEIFQALATLHSPETQKPVLHDMSLAH